MSESSDRKSHRVKAYVYHLSHVDNLASIVQNGLLSRRDLKDRGMVFTDVADSKILEGRSDHQLDTFVPFHFIPSSPFDCAVVAAAANKNFVLLAVRRDLARKQGWSIVPQHPLADGRTPEFLAWDQGIDSIRWEEMDKYPRPYDSDHQCKMVCMAEALAPQMVPFSSVAAVYAPTQRVVDMARVNIGQPTHCHINLSPEMFPKACR